MASCCLIDKPQRPPVLSSRKQGIGYLGQLVVNLPRYLVSEAQKPRHRAKESKAKVNINRKK